MPNTANPRLSNPLHSKKEVRWGTPDYVTLRVHRLFYRPDSGDEYNIDLDPCSSVDFNEAVKANKFYSLDDYGQDGLQLPWHGRVFCNPPGGLVRQFWRKAMSEPIEQMVWIGFSLEQLATMADEEHHPMDFSICIPRKRLRFTRHDGHSGSPTHSNYICGYRVDHARFTDVFKGLGRIYAPRERST